MSGFGRMLVVGVGVCLMSVVGGCTSDSGGYTFSSTYDRGIDVVAVPVFQNETFSRGTEGVITEAVVKEIQRATPWRVGSKENASAVLEGTITKVQLTERSSGRSTGLSEEVVVEIEVDFAFTDTRTGKVLASRRGFEASGSFIPALGVSERLEIGENEAIDRLARDLVDALRSGW